MTNQALQVVGSNQPEGPSRLAALWDWLERKTTTYVTVALVFVAMAARLFRLTYRYAVNIFFWDQWVFHNADLFQKHSWWQMFRWQFGPHRLGIGPWISTLIEPYSRWNSRSQSFLACSIVVLAAACALWLKKRLFGNIVIWDAAVPIIYLSASQYESLFITSDLAHGPLPLLLITLCCLAWTIQGVYSRYTVVLVINFVTIYTGFGILLGFLTPLLLIADYWTNLRGKSKGALFAATGVLISGGSLASFFLSYKFEPAANCFALKVQSPAQYIWYVSLMFANLWIKSVRWFAIAIGFTVLLYLLWGLLSASGKLLRCETESWKIHLISATLIIYSVLFCAATAIGRLCLGLGLAQSSRYMNYLALGILGGYLHAWSNHAGKLQRALPAIALRALLVSVPIRAADRNLMVSFRDLKKNWRTCYLAGGSIPACDVVAGSKIDPEPKAVLHGKLNYLRQTGQNLYSDTQ